jgi:hypothetical protein
MLILITAAYLKSKRPHHLMLHKAIKRPAVQAHVFQIKMQALRLTIMAFKEM